MCWRDLAVITATLAVTASCATVPPFQWTPTAKGTSVALTLVEERRERQGAVTTVEYRLEPKGFPVGRSLELWTKHPVEEAKVGTVTVDEQGKVRWRSKEPVGKVGTLGWLIVKSIRALTSLLPGDEVSLPHSVYVPAETRYWALFDPTTSRVAIARATPFPVLAEGSRGCRLSLELLSGDGRAFGLAAEGFEPDEELSLTSKSNGETVHDKPKFKQSGILSVLVPAVIGKNSGEATVTVSGRQCTVTLKYNWGQAALVAQ